MDNVVDELNFSLIDPYNFVSVGAGKLGYYRVGPSKEFPAYRKWGCAKNRDRLDVLLAAVGRYCKSVGGRIHGDLKLGLNKSWCVNQDGAPLFMVRLGGATSVLGVPDLYCSSGYDFGVYAVTGEKTSNQMLWSDWAALNLGYLTPSEARAKRVIERKMTSALNAAKEFDALQRRGAVLGSPLGTKVCHSRDGYRHVGFIEAKSGSRVKVFVTDTHLLGAPQMRPGGFRQGYTWDEAALWELC